MGPLARFLGAAQSAVVQASFGRRGVPRARQPLVQIIELRRVALRYAQQTTCGGPTRVRGDSVAPALSGVLWHGEPSLYQLVHLRDGGLIEQQRAQFSARAIIGSGQHAGQPPKDIWVALEAQEQRVQRRGTVRWQRAHKNGGRKTSTWPR